MNRMTPRGGLALVVFGFLAVTGCGSEAPLVEKVDSVAEEVLLSCSWANALQDGTISIPSTPETYSTRTVAPPYGSFDNDAGAGPCPLQTHVNIASPTGRSFEVSASSSTFIFGSPTSCPDIRMDVRIAQRRCLPGCSWSAPPVVTLKGVYGCAGEPASCGCRSWTVQSGNLANLKVIDTFATAARINARIYRQSTNQNLNVGVVHRVKALDAP